MDIQYFTSKPIPVKDLFNGRLGKYNIRELVTGDTTKQCRYLTDIANNNLTVITDEQECATCLLACEPNKNAPWIILSAIADEFDCDIISS